MKHENKTPNFWSLVVARMIGGFGVGASLIIAPMYIAEISPPKMRGQMVSFNQLNIVIGISVAFFTNYMILQLGQSEAAWAQSMQFDAYNWRWMLGLETLPAILYFFCLFFVPNSPRWLIMKGREDEALPIMAKANGEAEATQELAEIKLSIKADQQKESIPLAELFAPAMRLVLLIGVVIAILQQITGINSVFFYAPMIFEQSGIGTNASFVQAILVGLINLVFTLLAMALIDRLSGANRCSSLVSLALSFQWPCWPLASIAQRTPCKLTRSRRCRKLCLLNNLQQLEGQTFEGDLAYKAALANALGEDVATVSTNLPLITAAISMNPLLILCWHPWLCCMFCNITGSR